SYLTAILVVCGVFAGSALWWCCLTSGISLLRKKFTAHWLLWINRASGAVIVVFGVFVLYSLL
ncbi:MAG: LysE family translocator, partial [Ktedonobacteraceae bacterium]